AKGVLTAHGGMTSHAAVVARGMGKPCVAGCDGLDIDAGAKTLRIGGHQLSEGDVITIDGGTGRVIVGEVPLVPPAINEDFEAIFEAMAGLPVTIRLLDPPLHEFLPPLEEARDARMRQRIKTLTEANPMLGTRGCRLGIQWPEIYEMQVRAIARAAKAVLERGGDPPLVEIMHPLVGFREELRRLRELAEHVMEEEAPGLEYLCGTMIELPRAA